MSGRVLAYLEPLQNLADPECRHGSFERDMSYDDACVLEDLRAEGLVTGPHNDNAAGRYWTITDRGRAYVHSLQQNHARKHVA